MPSAYRRHREAIRALIRVDQGKPKLLPQSEVMYRDSVNRCEVCHFYIASDIEDAGECSIVAGPINCDGICIKFEPIDTAGSGGAVLMR